MKVDLIIFWIFAHSKISIKSPLHDRRQVMTQGCKNKICVVDPKEISLTGKSGLWENSVLLFNC